MATTPDEHQVTVRIDPLFSGLYVLQRDFQARILDALPSELSDREKMEYIREQALALTDELHEALAETGWKSWATSMHINREAYQGELADVFIFLMNLMLVAEITPTDLLGVVKAKIAKNHKRQDDGYDGVTTKCPGCKRAYDDDAVDCAYDPDADAPFCAVAGRVVA
jgi:NTP pyrophosphatase (non-canonical NTP hydrolase)